MVSRRVLPALSFACLALVVGVAGGAVPVLAAGQPRPDIAILDQATDRAAKVPAFYTAAADVHRVDLKTVHPLGGTEPTATYWAARSQGGDVCLVIMTPDAVASTACATPRDFNHHGVGARLVTREHVAEAYLVPDAVSAGSNLVVVPAGGPVDVETLQRVNAIAGPAVLRQQDFSLRIIDRGDESWHRGG